MLDVYIYIQKTCNHWLKRINDKFHFIFLLIECHLVSFFYLKEEEEKKKRCEPKEKENIEVL